MDKLKLRPVSSGYNATPNADVVATQTGGGFSRSRRDTFGGVATINVSWTLDEAKFTYLCAFYFTALANGTLPFLCDLLFDEPRLVEYQCKFVPGTFKPVANVIAMIFTASAQLELKPKPRDTVFDLSYVAYFNAYEGTNFAVRVSDIANEKLAELK